jgi:ABC-type phosphate transport system auxiliary subunit
VENLLWRAVSGIRDVEIELRFSGNVAGPRLAIRSNVGTAISTSLRRELQGEIADAERQVRARVNTLVAGPMRDARRRLNTLENEVQDLVAQRRVQLDAVKADLEARLSELTRILPPGVRIPPASPPLQ